MRAKSPVGIALSAPATASAGQVIPITVAPSGEAARKGVIVGTDRGVVIGSSRTVPYTCNYIIPLDTVGALTIYAAQTDMPRTDMPPSASYHDAEAVVQVTINAKLISMESRSQGLSFDQYMQNRCTDIVGIYSDGIERDLSSSASGTVYKLDNTGIVQIFPAQGILQAVGEGATTVTATNGELSLTIPVTVDLVDPDAGSRCGGDCKGYDLLLTYNDPVTLIPEPATLFYLPPSGEITLPANVKQMTFEFNNNSGLPYVGIVRGIATWKLGKGSDPKCSVSFEDNVLPTIQAPFAVQRGKMTVTLPPDGGTCIIETNIAGVPDQESDKWTIKNPAP